MIEEFVKETAEEAVSLHYDGELENKQDLQEFIRDSISEKGTLTGEKGYGIKRETCLKILGESKNSFVPGSWLDVTADVDEGLSFMAEACLIHEVAEEIFRLDGVVQAELDSHELPEAF
jgi:hypothetical protein